MEKLSKELLSLAGEYAVASELCKRSIYAQLALGHHKKTDILVETQYQMLKIQVKAKQGNEWPSISGLYSDDDLLALVDFKNKGEKERPDFYILNFADWKIMIKEEKQKYPEVQIDEQFKITYKDGWKGLNVKVSRVTKSKEQWNKITSKISNNTGTD